jgi:hypothetical protein
LGAAASSGEAQEAEATLILALLGLLAVVSDRASATAA